MYIYIKFARITSAYRGFTRSIEWSNRATSQYKYLTRNNNSLKQHIDEEVNRLDRFGDSWTLPNMQQEYGVRRVGWYITNRVGSQIAILNRSAIKRTAFLSSLTSSFPHPIAFFFDLKWILLISYYWWLMLAWVVYFRDLLEILFLNLSMVWENIINQ